MASINKTKHGTYRVRFRTPDGRDRSKTFKRRAEADAFAATVETSKLSGAYTDPSLGKTRFGDWAGQFQASRINLRPSTLARDDAYFRNLILPAFGHLRLAKIHPLQLQQWVSALDADGYAPATVRKAYQLVSAAFDAAVNSDLIPRTPCRGIKLPRMRRDEMRFLTADEIDHLADSIDSRYRALVLTAAYTGLRIGELAALKVNRLNMLRRQIKVVETLSEVRGELHLGPPKSQASRRTVTMPAFLVEELAAHLATYRDQDDWVFTSPEGGPIRRTNFRRRYWQRAVKASVGEPLRFHDLRHSHAALLVAQGVHPKVLQDRLGHASITTTFDTYGHLMAGLDQAAAEALELARNSGAGDRDT